MKIAFADYAAAIARTTGCSMTCMPVSKIRNTELVGVSLDANTGPAEGTVNIYQKRDYSFEWRRVA